MLVLSDGRIRGTIGGGQLELQIIDEAKKYLSQGKSETLYTQDYPLSVKTQQCCGGVVQALFEVFHSQKSLYIFGAGHVGQALSRVVSELPLDVHLIDERQEWVSQASSSVKTYQQKPLEFVTHREWKNSDFVVVLTHSHDLDFELIHYFCGKNIQYLGLIGSDTKWAQMRKKLQSQKHSLENIEKIRCPIGLKIGGKTPGEVAISIAAELLQETGKAALYENTPTEPNSTHSPVRW